MKVIPPSFVILDELDRQSLAIRIEACGRVCYKSEDKITESSTEPFVRNIIKRRHNSVMEMGVLSIKVFFDNEAQVQQLFETMPKFLFIDRLEKKVLLISGSVRAFRELFQGHPTVKMIKAITAFLAAQHPLFFFDLEPKSGWIAPEGISTLLSQSTARASWGPRAMIHVWAW